MSHLGALSRVSFDLGVFADIARQKSRRTLVYLVLLVAIASASATTLITLKLRDLVRRLDPHLDEIPTITIRNGRASADVEQPWVKRLGRDDSGKEIVVIIDTTGRLRDFEPGQIGVFLKRTTLAVKADGEAHDIPLSRFPDATVGPDFVRDFIAKTMRKVPLYVGAFLFVLFLFVKTVQALLLVVFAGSRLSFAQRFNVAVYALTPAIVADVLVTWLKLHIPLFWLVYLAIAVAYTILGAQRASAAPPSDTTSV